MRVVRFYPTFWCAANVSNLVLDLLLGLWHIGQTVRGRGHIPEAESSRGVIFIEGVRDGKR